MRIILGLFVSVFLVSPLVYSLAPNNSAREAEFLPSGKSSASAPQKKAMPKPPPTAGPKAPPPPEEAKNPIQKQLKAGQIFYRLDDRTGKLSCDKWTLAPTTKEDPTKGTLTFIEKKSDRSIVYTYGYQVSQDGSTWEFQINGIKGGRVEKIKGGVNFSQDIQCQEIFELGEARKTDFDLGSGVWYLNKASCDKAKKASSTKSPGSC
jgi:hypothetical protein